MTLIIYAKCIDGYVLISDRQASIGGGEKSIVPKIYSPQDKSFILALAGDGSRIEEVYTTFDTDPSLKEQDVIGVVKSILQTNYMENSEPVEGVVLIKNGSKYRAFKIFSVKLITTVTSLKSPFECFGLRAGKTIARFLSQFVDLENKNLEKATGFLVSSMDIISKNFDGIGTLNDGFDILSMSENGNVFEIPCFKKKHVGKITFKFKPSNTKILPSVPVAQNKSIRRPKKLKLKGKKIVKKIPTSLPIIKPLTDLAKSAPPGPPSAPTGLAASVISSLTAAPLITFPQPKCTKCGKLLSSMESILGSKCNECSSKETSKLI